MTVGIINLQKKIKFNPGLLAKIRICAKSTCRKFNKGKRPPELNLCFVDNKAIKAMNKKYFGKDYSTDVIAFEADVAVSAQEAVSNSIRFNTTAIYELLLYVIHGTLHILGHDDKNSAQRKLMREKEEKILTCLSIKPKQSS